MFPLQNKSAAPAGVEGGGADELPVRGVLGEHVPGEGVGVPLEYRLGHLRSRSKFAIAPFLKPADPIWDAVSCSIRYFHDEESIVSTFDYY